MQNKFFKISTDCNFPSEAEPSCVFSSQSVKKDKVKDVFVLKDLTKLIFDPLCKKEFFQISTDFDSPSEDEPLCPFSSKSVKK